MTLRKNGTDQERAGLRRSDCCEHLLPFFSAAAAPPSSVINWRRFTRSPDRRAGKIDVDNSTPHVSERDYDIYPRFSAFIGFVLHGYAHNDFRFFARAFAHSRSIISAFSTSVSRRCMNILHDKRPRGSRAAEQRDERAAVHVWMAPAWQEKM
jgi:hypothetical protein